MGRSFRCWLAAGLPLVGVLAACAGGRTTAPLAANPAPLHCDSVAAERSGPQDAALIGAWRRFKDSLSPTQQASLSLPLTRANAVRWSNLPVPAVPRVGVRLGDLTIAQQVLARSLIRLATSRCGLAMVDEIRLADDYISPIVPRFGWSSGNYYVAILGDPSSGSAWMLKVGGHHLAYNFTYDGHLPGATPLFVGAEPVRFAVGGKDYEPLAVQSQAMAKLALSVARHGKALLAGRFTDVVKGVEVTLYPDRPPLGGNDTAFPSPYPTGTIDRGVLYGDLSAVEQSNVRRAIEAYASLPSGGMSSTLVAEYERPEMLAQTFVGYANAPDLSMDGSYVRIDGPRVWMEFVVQPGVAYPDQLHYHALWRDKLADYGGEFTH